MPCKRKALSSRLMSSMVDLLATVGQPQAVIAAGIGARWLGELDDRIDRHRRSSATQASQHVEYMFSAYRTGLEHQLNGYQHTLQAGDRHCRQHLCHDAITASATQQRLL